jgi:hypothetical protein
MISLEAPFSFFLYGLDFLASTPVYIFRTCGNAHASSQKNYIIISSRRFPLAGSAPDS